MGSARPGPLKLPPKVGWGAQDSIKRKYEVTSNHLWIILFFHLLFLLFLEGGGLTQGLVWPEEDIFSCTGPNKSKNIFRGRLLPPPSISHQGQLTTCQVTRKDAYTHFTRNSGPKSFHAFFLHSIFTQYKAFDTNKVFEAQCPQFE